LRRSSLPRSLRRQPYQEPAKPPTNALLAVVARDTTAAGAGLVEAPEHHDSVAAPGALAVTAQGREATSIYRSPSGLRSSGAEPSPTDSTTGPAALSIRTLLDSATLALPDTAEFTIAPYHTRFTPDFVARPTVGYQRDNFGRGIFGGTAVSLSDMLGDRTVQLGGSLNGRISEAQVFATYINQTHRMNWASGFSQSPSYFYVPSTVGVASTPGTPGDSSIVFNTRVRRLVVRDLFASGFYPTSRFNRIELGLHAVDVGDATLIQSTYYDRTGLFEGVNDLTTITSPSIAYIEPTIAAVHDNTLFGVVGPFAGFRTRFQVAPAVGGWRFTTGLADVRKYFFARPFTLAVRTVFFGRFGRDGSEFPQFLGNTDLIRGYTANSVINHECQSQVANLSPLIGAIGGGSTGCHTLDQLIGSRVAVGNVELRFPLTRSLALGVLPIGFPPIEAALFYDAGLAWQNGSQIEWRPSACTAGMDCRAPIRSWGVSIRANMFGLFVMRVDYAKPLDRAYNTGYWTVSLGPTF